MKRNTIVIGVTLLILATFAWAGWANWEYRKQAAERGWPTAARAELIPARRATCRRADLAADRQAGARLSPPGPERQKWSLADSRARRAHQFLGDVVRPLQDRNSLAGRTAQSVRFKGFEILGISTEGDDLQPAIRKAWRGEERDRKIRPAGAHALSGADRRRHLASYTAGWMRCRPHSTSIAEGKVVAAQMGITSKDDMEANIQKTLGS